MAEFFRKHWFYSLVQIAALVVWVWWIPYERLPWAGVAIALIAGQAAVMSVHADMRPWQKVVWISIIGLFLVTELRAIRKDRFDQDAKALADRQAQDLAFAGVLRQENVQFNATKDGFSATTQNLNGVLATTQGVAGLAKESLEDITGGDSYAYIYPQFGAHERIAAISIHNFGARSLTGITVKIHPMLEGTLDFYGDLNTYLRGGLQGISVGTLPPHTGETISDAILSQVLRADGTANTVAYVYAQNGVTTESIFLRPSLDRTSYAFKLQVWRVASGRKRPGDRMVDGVSYRLVKTPYDDWTEPPQPQ